MAERLFVGVLGHQNSGKTYTWATLFGTKVNTGKNVRHLTLRPGECVDVFVVSGSFEERGKYAGDVLGNQKARIVLCSMQYVDKVTDTFDYVLDEGFQMHVQWLNPGRKDKAEYPDYLGLANRLLFSGATITQRNGNENANSRVQEIRECIYGWAAYRGLIYKC